MSGWVGGWVYVEAAPIAHGDITSTRMYRDSVTHSIQINQERQKETTTCTDTSKPPRLRQPARTPAKKMNEVEGPTTIYHANPPPLWLAKNHSQQR